MKKDKNVKNQPQTEEEKKETTVEETEQENVEKEEDPISAELAQLQNKADALEAELQKQKDILLRTMAEYDNYRKRTEREKAAIYNDAKSDTVEKILPIADNLERALEQKECSVEDLRKGVEMIWKQFVDAMEKLGIESMGEVGEPFNPDKHNAVSHIDSEELDENTVAAVFQKGYKIGDKVIRHAMVQVAN